MFVIASGNRNRGGNRSGGGGGSPSGRNQQQGFMLVPMRSGTGSLVAAGGNGGSSNSGSRFRGSGGSGTGSGSGGGGDHSSDSDSSDYDPNVNYDTRIPLDADEDSLLADLRGGATAGGGGEEGGTGNTNVNGDTLLPTTITDTTGGEGLGQQEHLRRQQVIRLGLLLCFFFFLLDGGSNGSGSGGSNSQPTPVIKDEIQLPVRETEDIVSLMKPLRPTRYELQRQNVSGEYRGYWRDAVIDSHTVQEKHNLSIRGGSLLVQTKTIPIKGIPDMSFVYGSIKFYNDESRPLLDWNKPLQGIAINSLQKMFLFPTMYYSQQLYVELSSVVTVSPSTSSTGSPTMSPTQAISTLATTSVVDSQHLNDHKKVRKVNAGVESESNDRNRKVVKRSKLAQNSQQTLQEPSPKSQILRGGSHTHGNNLHPHSHPNGLQHIRNDESGHHHTKIVDSDNAIVKPIVAIDRNQEEPFNIQRRLEEENSESTTSTSTSLTLQETDTGALLFTVQRKDISHPDSSSINEHFYLKVFVWDTLYGPIPYNLSSPSTRPSVLPINSSNTNEHVLLRYFPLGEQVLSKKFRDLQTFNDLDPNNSENRRRNSKNKANNNKWLNKEITYTTSTGNPGAGVGMIDKDCMRVFEIDFSTSHNKLLTSDDVQSVPKVVIVPPSVSASVTPTTAPTVAVKNQEQVDTVKSEGDKTVTTIVDRTPENDQVDLHNLPTANSMFGKMISCEGCRYRDSENDLIRYSNPTIKDIYITTVSYTFPQEMIERKTLIYSLTFVILCLIQVLCVIYQLKYATTQALNAKNSMLSVFAQSLLDALICMTHLLLGAAFPDLFFSEFIWISILKLLLFSVFQMRLVINSYQAIYATEIANEGWRGFRNRLVQLHLRFYGVVLFVLLFGTSMWFLTHPLLVILTLYSFWWPQVIHSVQTGTRPALHPYYIIGMSLTRLFLPLYLLACPVNFPSLLVEYLSPNYEIDIKDHLIHGFEGDAGGTRGSYYGAAVFLIAWMGFQVIMIFAQQYLGPRFFVPKRFLPQRYDYHRQLPASLLPRYPQAAAAFSSSSGNNNTAYSPLALDSVHGDVETGSLVTNAQDEESRHGHNHDDSNNDGLECVICYNSIHLNVSREYMITPCDHLFHEQCLTQWMRVKLECPVCRAVLPTNEEEES